jgi:hypothetical protein
MRVVVFSMITHDLAFSRTVAGGAAISMLAVTVMLKGCGGEK